MNIKQMSLKGTAREGVWSRILILGVIALALLIVLQAGTGRANAEGEDEFFNLRYVRLEFDDNDNADGLRPTSNNSFYIYYANASGNQSSGWYTFNVSGSPSGFSWNNVKIRYFTMNNTTSNNWQYYYVSGWYRDEQTAVIVLKQYKRVNELDITLNWSDNSNANETRPDTKDFSATLYHTNSNSSAGNTAIEGASLAVTDNGNDTWTLHFSNLDFQPTNSYRYVWLTWKDTSLSDSEPQKYFNQYKNTGNIGYMYVDLQSTAYTMTTIAKTDTTLSAVLTWYDSSNLYEKRPETGEFKPTLRLSNTTGSVTATNSKAITIGANGYTITDNGNNTWRIDFTDVNVKEIYSQDTSYRYLWLTWESSDYYINQNLDSSYFGAIYSDIANINNVRWSTYCTIIKTRLTWQDNSNQYETRPSVDDVKSSVKLLLSTTTANAESATDVTGTDISVTDNGDNTWDVIFFDSNARKLQTSNNNRRYMFLTWSKDGYYANESTSYSRSGVSYHDMYSYSSSSFYPYTQTPNYLKVTINWTDNNNEFDTRPDADTFKPKLYLSSSTSAITGENSIDVTGSYYTITDNGNSWTILFKDTNAREKQDSSYRYLWLTWDGDGKYLNETKKYYYSNSTVPYVNLYDTTSANVSFSALPSFVVARITWADQGNAANKRPAPDPAVFSATLHFSTSNTSITGTTTITTGDYTIKDNGNNTWSVVFWNTDLPYKLDSSYRYIWLTWEDKSTDTQFYANNALTSNEYGYTYSRARYYSNYGGSSVLEFTAKTRVLQIRLNWSSSDGLNSDNNNLYGTRPSTANFVPHLWGSANSSSAGDVEVTGTNWEIAEFDNYWVITLPDADEAILRGTYQYLWLTWEDISLGTTEATQYYFNQSKSTSQHGYTYVSASNSSYNFTAWAKVFVMKLRWKDNSDATGVRPGIDDDIKWHVWNGTSDTTANLTTDYGGTKWKVIDNGDDTWSVAFLDSDLMRVFYSGNSVPYSAYRQFVTWEGSDSYYNDVTNYTPGCIRFYMYYRYAYDSGRFNGNSSYWRQETGSYDGIYPKAITAKLTWRDGSNALGNRPAVEDFVPHLWYSTSTASITETTEVTGDYEITDNGDDTWTILFKNTNAKVMAGANTRYLWFTWDGSDQYYNNSTTNTMYGYNYASIYYSEVKTLNYTARQKPFRILLSWEDGDNFLGYRPSTDEFVPHVWRSNSNGGNKVEITGSNYVIKDNGDGTWLLTFPEPENLSGVLADQYYIWLTWEGSDQYYNNIKDTSFGYMRESFTNDNPYYKMITRAKHRELPLTLVWDDYSNAQGTRPDPTNFTPHLWYQTNNYNGTSWVTSWVEINGERDVDYQIITDQDSENKWVIRYMSIPFMYNRTTSNYTNNAYTVVQERISNYVLTWDGSDEYYNDVMTSGTYGYMSVAASSYSPSVTTRLKERSLDLTLRWSDYSDIMGLRPSIEEFTPQLYFGTNQRTNVPITIKEGSYTITDNGDNTWLIHFDNVPYAVATNSGSTNTYTNYWLTWTGSDEYLNQITSTSNTSYTTGCMFFGRESANPSVTTYLKTRERRIRLYWQDNQNANGYRPTPEYLLDNMHLWTGADTATVEIPMDDVTVKMVDTSNASYWDITIDHLPYYYSNGSYITNYSYYWLTWDGDNYINQVKSRVTPGAMFFSASSSDLTQVNCYPDEKPQLTVYVYWYDKHNELGLRPNPNDYKFQLYYGTDSTVMGMIPESNYEWEMVKTDYRSGEWDYWELRIKNLPRSIKNADGSETSFSHYWFASKDDAPEYTSNKLRYDYSGYFTNRISNETTSANVYNYLNHRGNVIVTLTWDDSSNSKGIRPSIDSFVPHLGYSEYDNSTRQRGVFDDVDYTIVDNGNNTWTITFKDVPLLFDYDGSTQSHVYYYWFTCDDVEGYTTINDYNANNFSRSTNISTSALTNSYNMTAKLSLETTKDITVTLSWQDNSNEWSRRPNTGSFVPHLWAGTSSEAKYEIPLTADQWELSQATVGTWTLKLKNIETIQGGNYWLTWDGSDYYYNQFTNTNRGGQLTWTYSNNTPTVNVYPRKSLIYLDWQDGDNVDGNRPDPNSWTPTLYYGNASGVIEQIELSPSDWYIKNVSGNRWTIEFYRLPYEYETASGSKANVSYYWLTFDTVDDYYFSDRTTSGYGELKWNWAINNNYVVNVYTKDRPLTINLTFADNNEQVGERPEPTPESLGAHLWYGTASEALGEIEGLTYTVTDNGNNTWTIVFDSVPGYYKNANGTDTAISYYWLTYGGGKYFINNIRDTFSGEHGAMKQAKNASNTYSMTTYCDYYRVGVSVSWEGSNSIANVSRTEIDHSHVQYDLVDTVTGEVLDTWEPTTPSNTTYSHTFYVPKFSEDGSETVDHHRYKVVQRGKPDVFEMTQVSSDYTSGVAGHLENIINTANEKLYRFNFTFNDDNNALKLRPTSLEYVASEIGGNTYTYRSKITGISSTASTYSSSIISLLGKDLMEGKELNYELDFTNLGKYYEIEKTERLDDDGIINYDYTFTLKTQPVTLQVEWEDNDNERGKRPVAVTEYLLANGINMLSDNSFTFTTDDAREDNENIWEKTLVLPVYDFDGNPITWSLRQVPSESLRNYHAEQESVQEPDFGGQTVTLTNIVQDDWNYSIELYWVSYGNRGSLPDKDYIDVANKYDIYETVDPSDDYTRKYKYELNISVNSAHYDVGDLEVRLPYYIEAVSTNGTTKYVAPLNPKNDISVPMAPDHNARYSFNYYIDDHGTADKSDDEIVFVNWEELSASSNLKIQVIYSLKPYEHFDTHIYDLQATGTGYAILNYDDETHSGDKEDVAEVQTSNTITLGMDTGVDITAFSKRASEPQLLYYYNTSYINSSDLSQAEFDTENFDYVAYYVNFTVHANQYSTFSVTDLPGQDGEIVSIRYNSGNDYGLNVKGPTYSADKRVWTYTVDPANYSSYNDHYMYRYYWVVVAYPKSEGNIIMEDGRIFTRYTNEADIAAETLLKQNPDDRSTPPPDHNDDDKMNDATFIEWGDYRWKPTGKIFYYDKSLIRNFNSGNTNKQPGGQTVLEYGEDIEARFRMIFYVNGDELMMDGVHEYYRFNITDNELWLHGTVNGGKTDYVKLEPGDYEITAIDVYLTARRTDHTTGQPLPNVPLGQFVLQGQTNETGKAGGEWVNLKTYSWPAGSTSQTQSFSISGLTGRGITGYRISTPRVNEYVQVETYFTVKLKAESEKVKALIANGELLTEIEMLNIAAFPMEIEEPDGSWSLYTNIYRQYSGAVEPGVPSHTDNEAVRVGLYGTDPDRLTYGTDVELIYDHALAQATPITSSVGMSKNTDTVEADSLTEIVKAQFTLSAYQSMSNTTGIPLWLQHEIVVREGYYYDLLPEGWLFDPTASIIVRRYSGIGAAMLVGEPVIIDDYKGTNRQMVIFHVKTEGDQINYGGSTSGFTLTFGATQSYEMNALYPRGYNIAVFQGVEYDKDGNPMYDANGNYIPQVWELMHTNTTSYYDDGAFGNSVYNVIRDDGNYVFYDVNGDGKTNQNDVLYMNSFVNPNFAKSVQTGVDKLIMGKSGIWQLHDVTDLDTDYYYYLSYRTTGQGTSRDVIIYDVLENAANTAGHKDEHYWKGEFKGIDVSYARALGIDAVVYYSTATNLNENNNPESFRNKEITESQIQMDIDRRPDLWIRYDSASAPKDKITAIAVDMRKKTDGTDKIFDGNDNEEVYFTITMHSPKELPDDPEAILAYNRPCYQTILNSGGADTERFNINDRVTIELHDLKTVTLKKITRSDPLTDENGVVILDENGNFKYEEMPLGSVFFQLYELVCTNPNHTSITSHSAPPATTNMTSTSSNSCWRRIAVGQTKSDGTVSFENLETGTYAIREYSPYYYSSYDNSLAYVIASRWRLENMWWSFDVNARSKDEPVLVYRGNTTYNGSSYADFAFNTKDAEILSWNEGDTTLTRKVWNVRTRQNLTISKQWWPTGSDTEFGIESIKVNILRNGEVYIKDVELTRAANWTTTIKNLPVTSAYGTRYHYTIQETEETRAALEKFGFKVVVDNNAYTDLGGSNTGGYTQTRRLHNATLDHLIITKTVAEGGDREKKYLFSIRLTNQENYVLTGSYDYTLYRYDEEEQKWVAIETKTFTLDANGTWGEMWLAHNERIIIEGLPVGTKYVITENGADGYVQTTTKGSLSNTDKGLKASEENEDLVSYDAKLNNETAVLNTYRSEGRAQVTATKTINGRRPVYFTDRTFTYYIKPIEWHQEGAAEGAADVVTTYRLNGTNVYSIDFNANNGKGYSVTNGADGSITFPTLLWRTAVSGYKGYRVYTIREEVDKERPGFELDKTVFVAWVELEDDQSGTLKSNVTYYKVVLGEGETEVDTSKRDTWEKLEGVSDLKFNNIYSAEGELAIRLKKTINGLTPAEGEFKDKTFKFTLYKNDNDRVGDKIASFENDDDGIAEFSIGKFTIDDVGSNQFFRYFLQEDVTDHENTTIDSVLYSLTVQITDKGEGVLGAKIDVVATRNGTRTNMPTITIDKLPIEGEDSYDTDLEKLLSEISKKLTFNNVYKAEGSWQPEILKLVNGEVIDTDYFANNSFTFTLSSVADGKETLISTIKNAADGTGVFEAIEYDESDIAKTYTYVIHETGTAGKGVTVNDTPWTIVIRVDDEGDGVLSPTITSISKDGTVVWNSESTDAMPTVYEFDNSYEATGSLTIEGTKVLIGRPIKDGEFEFAIVDEDDNVVAKGKSDADGKISFGTIKFTQANENKHYDYRVYEVDNGIGGITYDELVWLLSIDVTDSGTGELDVSYTLTKQSD